LADRKTISANGQDVVHVEVNVQDDKNNFVPDASNKITFKLEGDATIIAVDNGNPLNTESFNSSSLKVFNGKCLVIIKSTNKIGKFTLLAQSDSLENAEVTVVSK
jgi:beta-galactosidase